MGRYTRQELQDALDHYTEVVESCRAAADWAAFADLFTEDAVYTEHAYGVFTGREAIRAWIVQVMAPFPMMFFPRDWVAFDEEAGAVVMGVRNALPHPTDPSVEFSFPNWTRLVYAGDDLFSSEEDMYNPARDAPEVIGAWLAAGGRPAQEIVTHDERAL